MVDVSMKPDATPAPLAEPGRPDRAFRDVEDRVIERLKSKGFVFLVADETQEATDALLHRLDPTYKGPLESRLEAYEASTRRFTTATFSTSLKLQGVPDALADLAKAVFDVEVTQDDRERAEQTLHLMKETFPLNAIKVSVWGGTKYLALLPCDGLQPDQIRAKARAFERVADGLRAVAGRVHSKVFGLQIGKGQEHHVHAALCLIFTDAGRYRKVQPSVEALRVKTDAMGKWFAKQGWKYATGWSLVRPPPTMVLARKVVYRTYDDAVEGGEGQLAFFLFHGFTPEDILKASPIGSSPPRGGTPPAPA